MESSEFIDECDALFLKYKDITPRIERRYEKIYAILGQYIGNPKTVLARISYLRQKLIISFVENGFCYFKYYHVLDFIRGAARYHEKNSHDDSLITDWKSLMEVIMSERGQLISDGDEYYKKAYSHYHRFARSYIRLKRIGVEFEEGECKIYIARKSNKIINNEINEICRRLGGKNLQKYLANRLERIYNPITKRFMEYRKVALGIDNAAIPFGYLVAIVSKYAGTSGTDDETGFDYLVEIITDVIVIFEIQPYSELESMYFEADQLIDFIRKNIFYDVYVGILQVNHNHGSAIIEYLMNYFSDEKYLSYGVKVKDAIKVARKLIVLASTKKFSKTDIHILSSKLGLSKFKVEKIMDNLLSVKAGEVNKNLEFPPKSSEIDHHFKPTIKKGNEYIIYPKSITALACVNAVCNAIGRPNDVFSNPQDSELGYAIEDFLREKFLKKDIDVTFGDREQDGEKIEADLICENQNNIYIFEMKKKGLTRDAQSGREIKIYQDIADSALRSHFQAMRIERALINYERIVFSKNGIDKSVCLNGRPVKRVSVSLYDFGALQDKVIFQRILTIATHSNLTHPDPVEDKKLDNWRNYSQKIRDLAVLKDEIGVANKQLNIYKVPFHDSLFLSVPQLLLMLEVSESKDAFFNYLESFISVTNGSRDIYTELLHKNNLFKEGVN